MLKKLYLGVGLFLCLGLGVAYASGMKAPNLGIADSFKGGSGSGRSGGGFFYMGGGGGGFGK